MWASMRIAALVAVFLCSMSSASRTSLDKKRSRAFLAASSSEGHLSSRVGMEGSMELGRLQKQTNQMYSDINEVQKSLEMALLQLGQWVEHQLGNASNSTKVHPTEEAQKKVHDSSTNSTNVPPKAEANKEAHAISTNSTKATPKVEANTKVVQPAKTAANKAPKVVAAVGTKHHVSKAVKSEETVLEKLFKHLKSNIANFNKDEVNSKQVALRQIQRYTTQIKKEKAELQQKGISKFTHELLVNRTRTDTFELQYWSRDRSLGHQMFHSNLKMTHGLMSRVQTVISACKDAIAKGHVDKALWKKVQEQALPHEFIQMRANVKHRAQQYYAHVFTARWGVAQE